jgi:hypothetical protein
MKCFVMAQRVADARCAGAAGNTADVTAATRKQRRGDASAKRVTTEMQAFHLHYSLQLDRWGLSDSLERTCSRWRLIVPKSTGVIEFFDALR